MLMWLEYQSVVHFIRYDEEVVFYRESRQLFQLLVGEDLSYGVVRRLIEERFVSYGLHSCHNCTHIDYDSLCF